MLGLLSCTHDDIVSPTSCALSCILVITNFVSNSLYFGVNEIISFQKLVGNLDNMTVVNLTTPEIFGLLCQDILFVFVWSYKLLFHHLYCLNSLYIF